VLDLVHMCRPKDKQAPDFVRELIEWGPGPRACQHLVLGAKVRSVLHGRYHVTLDDVEALARPVLRHRIVPTFNAEAEGITVDDIVDRVLKKVPRGTAASVL
jgi:MoxR-like ATPase